MLEFDLNKMNNGQLRLKLAEISGKIAGKKKDLDYDYLVIMKAFNSLSDENYNLKDEPVLCREIFKIVNRESSEK